MGSVGVVLDGLKPGIMMTTVQIALAAVNLLYKMASNDGMSLKVLVTYRFIFAAASLLPIALYVDRNKRPKLTWRIILEAFLCALFGGSVAQNLYAESLALTSATFASATTNLVPAITFVLAVFFRMERLQLGTIADQAKVVGTLVGMGGAMILTLYKGAELDIWSTNIDLLKGHVHQGGQVASSQHQTTSILGLFLALAYCLSVAVASILQAKLSQSYPRHFSSTCLMSFLGAVQSVIYAFCAEKDWNQWKLGWNIRLLTVAYSGIVVSGLMATFVMLCVRMRGPLYVSIFNPLMLVLVAIAASLFINEQLHVGSVVGAVIIIIGLYMVLWGKRREMSQLMSSGGGSENPRISSSINVLGVAPHDFPIMETDYLAEVVPTDHHENDEEAARVRKLDETV